MKPEQDRRHWQEMLRKLTDPEEIEKAKQKADKEQRIKEEISDTGL